MRNTDLTKYTNAPYALVSVRVCTIHIAEIPHKLE